MEQAWQVRLCLSVLYFPFSETTPSWWTPTAAGYFDHVSKAKALEAVQVFAPGEVQRLAKLKKAQIASEAEWLAAGTGWLPQVLLTPEVSEVTEHAEAKSEEVDEDTKTGV